MMEWIALPFAALVAAYLIGRFPPSELRYRRWKRAQARH